MEAEISMKPLSLLDVLTVRCFLCRDTGWARHTEYDPSTGGYRLVKVPCTCRKKARGRDSRRVA